MLFSEKHGYQEDALIQSSFLAWHKGRRTGAESAGALCCMPGLHMQLAVFMPSLIICLIILRF